METNIQPSNCPQCGSGDVMICNISVRPYCYECHHWAPVNFGTLEESVSEWNKKSAIHNGE